MVTLRTNDDGILGSHSAGARPEQLPKLATNVPHSLPQFKSWEFGDGLQDVVDSWPNLTHNRLSDLYFWGFLRNWHTNVVQRRRTETDFETRSSFRSAWLCATTSKMSESSGVPGSLAFL